MRRWNSKYMAAAVGWSAIVIAPGGAGAATVFVGDRVGFEAAIAALPGGIAAVVEDYEGFAAGDAIADGATFNGITYDFSATPVIGEVKDDGGTSGANTLGADLAPGSFGTADALGFTFAPAFAFGLEVVVSDTLSSLLAGDINLAAAGVTASNAAGDSPREINGVEAFFVGVVDADAPFTSALLTFEPGGTTFTSIGQLDDLTLAPVPLPGAVWLLGAGLVGLGVWRRRR